MTWRFEVAGSGQRDIERLDAQISKRIIERLKWFSDHFEEQRPLGLTGAFDGSFKLRVGDWRIVYEIRNREQIVYVLAVEHRSKVYKKHR